MIRMQLNGQDEGIRLSFPDYEDVTTTQNQPFDRCQSRPSFCHSFTSAFANPQTEDALSILKL